MAVISLGIAEAYAGRLEDADRHLEQGVALARQVGRPYLELMGLAHDTVAESFGYQWGGQSSQATELAERHGWGETQAGGVAYTALAMAIVRQGRLEEAEAALERAGRALRRRGGGGSSGAGRGG